MTIADDLFAEISAAARPIPLRSRLPWRVAGEAVARMEDVALHLNARTRRFGRIWVLNYENVAAPMAALVIIVQLGGSALVISGWNVWLGARGARRLHGEIEWEYATQFGQFASTLLAIASALSISAEDIDVGGRGIGDVDHESGTLKNTDCLAEIT